MAFTFKLEHPDGTPAAPPTLTSAVPDWAIDEQIPFGPGSRRCGGQHSPGAYPHDPRTAGWTLGLLGASTGHMRCPNETFEG
jgi:hypothetical protein